MVYTLHIFQEIWLHLYARRTAHEFLFCSENQLELLKKISAIEKNNELIV